MKTITWTLYEVHAGDKRKDWTSAQYIDAILKGGHDGTDPEYHFYIVAPDDYDFDLGVAMAPAFKKFGVKRGNDLPDPFSMERVKMRPVVGNADSIADYIRTKIGAPADIEILVASKALYRELTSKKKGPSK